MITLSSGEAKQIEISTWNRLMAIASSLTGTRLGFDRPGRNAHVPARCQGKRSAKPGSISIPATPDKRNYVDDRVMK